MPLNTGCETMRHKKVSWDEPASSLHVLKKRKKKKNYAKDQFQILSYNPVKKPKHHFSPFLQLNLKNVRNNSLKYRKLHFCSNKSIPKELLSWRSVQWSLKTEETGQNDLQHHLKKSFKCPFRTIPEH